jgi:hypothetical protein
MNRLTTNSNILDVVNDDTFAFQCFLKLKKYEDTGLLPEDIEKLKSQNNMRGQLIKSVNIIINT